MAFFYKVRNAIESFKDRKRMKACKDTWTFINKMDSGWYKTYTVDDIEKEYKKVFRSVYRNWFGWKGSDKQIDSLYRDLVQGNWDKLYYTEIEEHAMDSNYVFEKELLPLMSYVCDRWSFDRLCRVHYIFRLWSIKVGKSNEWFYY